MPPFGLGLGGMPSRAELEFLVWGISFPALSCRAFICRPSGWGMAGCSFRCVLQAELRMGRLRPCNPPVFNRWRNLTLRRKRFTLSATCCSVQQEQRSPIADASIVETVRAMRHRGLSLVRSVKQSVPTPLFRAGESIRDSGLYRVLHGGHRGNHEAILLVGELFPRCAVCGENVHFELLQAAPHLNNDPQLRSRKLFELPHPETAKSA